MKYLLNGVPILFANEYTVGARTGDEHRLVGGGRFIEQPVQLLAGLTGTDCVHVQEPTHSGHKKHGVKLESSRCFGQCELHIRGQAESDEIIRGIEVCLLYTS